MANQGEDDLQASTTEGFKVGEKKTVEEYAKLGECMKLNIFDDGPPHTSIYPLQKSVRLFQRKECLP